MERMHQGGMREDYWSMPVTREKQDEDEREEVLRGAPIVLPKVEPTSKTASLEAGDWLAASSAEAFDRRRELQCNGS